MVDELTLVLLAIAVDTLTGVLGVSYLAGWWSVRKNERWMKSDRSAPYKVELGKAAVAQLPTWLGKFDPAEFRAQLLAETKLELATFRSELTALRDELPEEVELPPWVKTFDPPAFAEGLRVSIVQTYRGLKGGRPSREAVEMGEAVAEAKLLEHLGDDAEDYELVKLAAGDERARQFILGKRLLERARARRGGPPASREGPPAGQTTLTPQNEGSRRLNPAIVAALEAEGFTRKTLPAAVPNTSSQG